MKKWLLIISLLSLFVLVLAGCGETEETGSKSNSNGNSVTLVASNWKFDKEEYRVPAGELTIILENKEGHHGIIVEDTDLKIDGESQASTKLDAGEYTIRCAIPCGGGHNDMTAKLIVE